jgi:hypothetical protein
MPRRSAASSGSSNDEARHVGILYDGPHYHQAVDILIGIFGDKAKEFGWATADPKGATPQTIYSFRSKSPTEAIERKLRESPHARLFVEVIELDSDDPMVEQARRSIAEANAAAGADPGELPQLPEIEVT